MNKQNKTINAILNTTVLVVILILAVLSTLHAEYTAEQGIGATEYSNHCAACHGGDGKGNGPEANQLATMPTDLTLLRKENGGSFPETSVYNIIDGRRVGDYHGQEMPIWGEYFKDIEGDEDAIDARISNLIEYLKSIQAE